MKLRRFLLAILIATASLQAQVGIGTKNPESKLEVNGDVKIGNEGKTDAQGKKGMMRWSEANTCFEGHNGTKWKCLDYKPTFDLQKPMLRLEGGEALRYNNGQGWENNNSSESSAKNVVKLNVNSGTNTAIYDPQSGTITVDEDGTYKLSYDVNLANDPAGGAFDGQSGLFITFITLNNQLLSPRNMKTVLRGVKVNGGTYFIQNSDSRILYLKKGDKLHVRFTTYGTDSMNTNTNNIYISKGDSSIKLWKL